MNELVSNVQEENVSRGQTSDCLETLPTLPEDYEWEMNRYSFDDFFTYEDWVYMLKLGQLEFEENSKLLLRELRTYGTCLARNFVGRCNVRIWLQFKPVYNHIPYSEPSFRFVFTTPISKYSIVSEYSKSKLLEMGYEKILNIIMSRCGLYDFSGDLSIVPDGVTELFAYTLEKIDKEKDAIQTSFLWMCIYLNDLANVYDKDNFLKYGCRNIYDFAEKRFGFGRTSIKNFLAIYDKFIDGVTVKPAFKEYSYSQLTELVSVSSENLDKFSADMTVKEIREKKKNLDKHEGESSSSELQEVAKPIPLFAEPVKVVERQLNENAVLDIVKNMKNPYFCTDKDKQSARYDAYEKALNDVLFALRDKLGCAGVLRISE